MIHIQNSGKIGKLLEMAAHSNTPENEALNALRMANTALSDSGISLTTLLNTHGKVHYPSYDKEDVQSILNQVEPLVERVATLTEKTLKDEATIRKQKEKLKDYKEIIESLKTQTAVDEDYEEEEEEEIIFDEDGMSFMEFRAEVIQRLGKENAWQTNFCEQTKTPLARIQTARRLSEDGHPVPSDLVELLPRLTALTGDRTKYPWTGKEIKRLKELMATKLTYTKIALHLNREFGRNRSENSIKGTTDRIRKGMV